MIYVIAVSLVLNYLTRRSADDKRAPAAQSPPIGD